MIGPQFYDVLNGKLSKDCINRLQDVRTCYNFSLVDQCILIQVIDVSCMAPGCSNRVKQNSISFYRLPIKDSTRLQKRLNNMKLNNQPNLKYCKLCSKHFTEECYEEDPTLELLEIKKQVKLKNDAVPTLFNFSSYNMLTGKEF